MLIVHYNDSKNFNHKKVEVKAKYFLITSMKLKKLYDLVIPNKLCRFALSGTEPYQPTVTFLRTLYLVPVQNL